MNICPVVVSLQCRLHIHASYSTTMKMNVPMLPLSQPNAVGVILAHGKRRKKATFYTLWHYEMSKNTFHPYFCRQHRRRGLGSLPWRVRVWWRRLLVAVGPQGPPPLCYPGLWRPPGGYGAHQLTCESNQVNIPEYTRWFLRCRTVLSTFSNHLPASRGFPCRPLLKVLNRWGAVLAYVQLHSRPSTLQRHGQRARLPLHERQPVGLQERLQ